MTDKQLTEVNERLKNKKAVMVKKQKSKMFKFFCANREIGGLKTCKSQCKDCSFGWDSEF